MKRPTQIKTNTRRWSFFLKHPHFLLGLRDGAAGRGFFFLYDDWDYKQQWNYELGRSVGLFVRMQGMVLPDDGSNHNTDYMETICRQAINAGYVLYKDYANQHGRHLGA